MTAFSLLCIGAVPGIGQNFDGDARSIAMGSGADHRNMALSFAGTIRDAESRRYLAIPVPLGLFQILRNTDIYKPSSDNFNPLRAIENISNPLHLTFGRGDDSKGEQLVSDIVNGTISRDLTTYRGFAPKSSLKAQGLMDTGWGKTFAIAGRGGVPLHGIYVGAGPYVSMGTDIRFDQALIDVFSGATGTPQNSTLHITNTTQGQVASAVTAGYRVRVPLPSLSNNSNRNGLYLAANYNYLYGFHYDTVDLNVRFDTDSAGLLAPLPSTIPLAINRETSSTGHGFALDIASGLVIDRWVFGAAAAGVGNRIDWEGLRAEKLDLTSLVSGLDFVETALPSPGARRRIELPVRYSGSGAYYGDKWAVKAEAAHGLQDFEFHGGAEYTLGPVQVRGGGRRVRDLWHPSGGIGFNLIPKLGVDVAAFTTATNIEQARKVSLAVSLRLNQ